MIKNTITKRLQTKTREGNVFAVFFCFYSLMFSNSSFVFVICFLVFLFFNETAPPAPEAPFHKKQTTENKKQKTKTVTQKKKNKRGKNKK